MKNISIRSTLTAAIAMFVLMTIAIAGMSLFMLTRSNETTVLVHDAQSQVILINDVYKNSTRTRAAFAL